jgi:hypothetical protein
VFGLATVWRPGGPEPDPDPGTRRSCTDPQHFLIEYGLGTGKKQLRLELRRIRKLFQPLWSRGQGSRVCFTGRPGFESRWRRSLKIRVRSRNINTKNNLAASKITKTSSILPVKGMNLKYRESVADPDSTDGCTDPEPEPGRRGASGSGSKHRNRPYRAGTGKILTLSVQFLKEESKSGF